MVTTKCFIVAISLCLIIISSSTVNAVTSEAAQDLMNDGWSRINSGDTTEGIQLFESALNLSNDDPIASSEILLNIGAVYYQDGDYQSAIDSFNKGLELYTESATLYYYKGMALQKTGKIFEANEYFEKAGTLDSRYQIPFYKIFPYSLLFDNIPLILGIIGFSVIAIIFVKKELI